MDILAAPVGARIAGRKALAAFISSNAKIVSSNRRPHVRAAFAATFRTPMGKIPDSDWRVIKLPSLNLGPLPAPASGLCKLCYASAHIFRIANSYAKPLPNNTVL
jgi:hypothetical protein